jgi:16S rRNA C1402 (ribose-2'-O) methylase RsmI
MHEEFVRTTVKNLPAIAREVMQKGEFVVIVGSC